VAVAMLPDELQTGIAELDTQHENLFRLIQDVKSSLLGSGHDQTCAMSLLADLAIELAMHFAWEEQAASEIGMPFANHTREHQRIKRFLLSRTEECVRGRCNIPALLVFLDRQFESHVTHYDQALGQGLHAGVDAEKTTA
jgi:hemerythrin-like metal-binding protein